MNFLLRKDEAEKTYLNKTEADSLLAKKANVDEIDLSLEKKVDVVEGMGLSTNDFTDELKNKLEGIEEEANKVDMENIYTKSEVDNKYFMTMLRGTAITSGQDLNKLTTPGTYYAMTSTIANSCLNIPGRIKVGFRLDVLYSHGTKNMYMIQRLYHTSNNSFYIWCRGLVTSSEWSPWYLLNQNAFTSYNYNNEDLSGKYMKIASYGNIQRSAYRDYTMVFMIHNNAGTVSTRENNNGILYCHLCLGNDYTVVENMQATWLYKGSSIILDEWFLTFDHKERSMTLWKKLCYQDESYTITLLSNSMKGTVGDGGNAVYMYYLKDTIDEYVESNYQSIVTSTICDSTAITKKEFDNSVKTSDWTSVSIGSDVTSGSIEYKQFNTLTTIVGKNIRVLNAVKTVSIGSLSVNQRPRVTIRIPTDTINVFVIIATDGTISLESVNGNLSTSDSYTFSATYLI